MKTRLHWQCGGRAQFRHTVTPRRAHKTRQKTTMKQKGDDEEIGTHKGEIQTNHKQKRNCRIGYFRTQVTNHAAHKQTDPFRLLWREMWFSVPCPTNNRYRFVASAVQHEVQRKGAQHRANTGHEHTSRCAHWTADLTPCHTVVVVWWFAFCCVLFGSWLFACAMMGRGFRDEKRLFAELHEALACFRSHSWCLLLVVG
jgi:hypothetical protein